MTEPKKRGRPPKPAAERRRHNQTFRCNDEMLARLQREAEQNQRSVSEEVEYRVAQALQKDVRLQSVLAVIGGADKVMFASMANGDLRIAIEQANTEIGGPLEWYESPEKLNVVRRHMQDVVGRTVDAFAKMVQNGVAERTGDHMSKLAD